MGLLSLPPETLGAQIAGRLSPGDVAAIWQTCAVLAELCRSDPVLWRTVADAHYDDVEVSQSRKLLAWEDGAERAIDAVDVDWRALVTERHRLAAIVRRGDEDARIATYNDVARMMLSMAANARVADEEAGSRNAAFLQQLFASPEIVEFYLHRDFESLRTCSRTASVHPGEGVQTRSRSRSDLSGTVDPILSRRLHLLRGLFVPLPHPPPVLSASSTALSRMARGRARETVYDLARYGEANSFGPFLLDGSGRVDWVTLEAVSCVMGHNVHAALAEWRNEAAEVPHDPDAPAGEATGPYEVDPPRGDFAHSLPWPPQPKTAPADAIEVDGLPFDWAGVDGCRQATSYAFLDYRQLHLFNRHRDAAGNRHRLDRDIEGVGDIMRFSLRQCAPPEDKDEHVPASMRSDIVPPLFFSGTSVSAMLMRTRVRGSVWITPDRQIAWHYIIAYGGEDRWSLRGVQTTGVSAPILLTGLLLGAEVSLLVPLLLPWPLALRRKVVKAVLESRVVAQVLWGVKICLIFVTILLIDSGNRIVRMEFSRRRMDDPEFDTPISPEVGASTDRAAKKLVSERNAAVAASTLLVCAHASLFIRADATDFVLWRTFAREIELHRLHEKIAKLEGGPDVDHSEFIEDSVRIHDEISKQESDRRKPRAKGMDGDATAKESQL